jgi:4-hydroxybenzoate polyprenyltransferase
MRGAGCTVNDMWDRDIDGKVARTKERPLAAGTMSMPQATGFLAAQLSVALACAVPLGWDALSMAVPAAGVVALYPLMKRLTWWPQAVLGAAMNWGILIGWAAVHGTGSISAVVPLWAGAACWTIVYDTLYAHQDTADDEKLGLKSTALLFGKEYTKPVLTAFTTGFATLASATVLQQGLAWPAELAVVGASGHMLWQIWTADFADRWNLTNRFVSNKQVGAMMLAGLVAGRLFQIGLN